MCARDTHAQRRGNGVRLGCLLHKCHADGRASSQAQACRKRYLHVGKVGRDETHYSADEIRSKGHGREAQHNVANHQWHLLAPPV